MAHIVLAEDDMAMRQFLDSALQKAGHEVIPFEDGRAAYDYLKQTPAIDLLLTDIVMPSMDGLELSQRAVKLHPSLKVLFITGFSAVALGEKKKINAVPPTDKVITKPFHLGDLVKQVEHILAE